MAPSSSSDGVSSVASSSARPMARNAAPAPARRTVVHPAGQNRPRVPSSAPSSSAQAAASNGRTLSRTDSTMQQSAMATEPKDIVASLPFTLLPASLEAQTSAEDNDTCPTADEYTFSRLVDLAEKYLSSSPAAGGGTERGHRGWSSMFKSDLTSATFYSWLALQHTPTSLLARRLLATCLIYGGEPFPFGPSNAYSTPLSLAPLSSRSATSTADRAGARAAIELFQEGPDYMFRDVDCANAYAHACSLLGRVREAQEALAWANEAAASQPASSDEMQRRVEKLHARPPCASTAPRNHVNHLALADMSAKAQQNREARRHYRECRQLDPWCWAAWTGLCDVRNDDPTSRDTLDQREMDGPVPADIAGFQTEFDARSLYPNMLKDALTKRQIDPSLVQCILDSLSTGVESGAKAARGDAVAESSSEVPPQSATTTTTTNVEGAAPPRPGTRTAGAVPGVVGSKRLRTETQANGTTVKARQAINPTAPAPAPVKKMGESGKAGVTAASATTTKPPGTFGTLSTAKQNEQRPPSVASTSSIRTAGTIDKDVNKPRRSPRVMTGASSSANRTRPVMAPGAAKRPVTGQQTSAVRPTTTTATAAATRPTGIATTSRILPGAKTRPPISSSVSEPTAGRQPQSQQQRRKLAVDLELLERIQAAVYEAAELAIKESSSWRIADGQVKELFLTFAGAYKAIRSFRGRYAIALLRPKGPMSPSVKEDLIKELHLTNASMPPVYSGLDESIRNSFHVHCLIARAYHDTSRYHLAEKHFAHAAKLSPSLSAHMDICSLTLFHLHREVELSTLAQRLMRLDESSCVAHLAQGNAFALQHEHRLALKCFRRAACAAPEYAYAYTLAGYEALELGKLDEALEYFQRALSYERRHWNAYAGLAHAFASENQHSLALHYYSKALNINEQNAALWDLRARTLMSLGRLDEAQGALQQALKIDFSGAATHAKLAENYLLQADKLEGSMAERKRDLAHKHLLFAVQYAPQEAELHLLLAKSYMRKGGGEFAPVEAGKSSSGGDHAGGNRQMVRAVGNPTLPTAYQDAVSHHLCVAVEIEPRLLRQVKAMGEGVRASLRGAASRLAGTATAQQHVSFATTADGLDDTYANTMGMGTSMADYTGNYVHEDSVQQGVSVDPAAIEESEVEGSIDSGSLPAAADASRSQDVGRMREGARFPRGFVEGLVPVLDGEISDVENAETIDGGSGPQPSATPEAPEGGRMPATGIRADAARQVEGEDASMSL